MHPRMLITNPFNSAWMSAIGVICPNASEYSRRDDGYWAMNLGLSWGFLPGYAQR